MGTTGKHLGKMVNPKNDQWRGTIVSQTLDQGNRLRLQENCLFKSGPWIGREPPRNLINVPGD